MKHANVLVVDDDRGVRTALRVNLSKRAKQVFVVENAEQALETLDDHAIDIMISDVRMPGKSGIDLLREARGLFPNLPVIMMTGFGTVDDAVLAMKAGASDYLTKPIAKDELITRLERALAQRDLQNEVRKLRKQVEERYGFESIIGTTPVMQKLYEDIAAVAESSATVLLEGPTGTGKELLAHAIHYRSPRAQRPFVRVNCAAIPETLIESELFGHEKGSFSGAIRQHLGKFEQADGGTILLDEIGEVDLLMQVKLLRILQNGEFQRVGGTGSHQVNVRVVAATNKDLANEVEHGRFREDLYYRLNVVRLNVPSLAERRDDIPLLADHFLRKFAQKYDKPLPQLPADTLKTLMSHAWPGNVRQLEHIIERAVVMSKIGSPLKIHVDKARPSESAVARPAPALDGTLPEMLEQLERQRIIEALQANNGVQAKAARQLGVSRSNLNYRINKLGIRVRNLSYS